MNPFMPDSTIEFTIIFRDPSVYCYAPCVKQSGFMPQLFTVYIYKLLITGPVCDAMYVIHSLERWVMLTMSCSWRLRSLQYERYAHYL